MNSAFEDRFEFVRSYEFYGADVVVRRYLSSEKFIDFGRTGELYFAPASRMSDPEEGFFTRADQSFREEQLKGEGFNTLELNMAREAWDKIASGNAKAVVLSCWSMGVEEDSRMWDAYGQSTDAVAIETTVHALRRAIDRRGIVVPVRYVDRDCVRLPRSHSLLPFFFKGIDFSWERELRIVAEMGIGNRLETPRRLKVFPDLINFRFVIAPGARRERAREVRELLSVLHSKPNVVRSSLERKCRLK